MLDEDVLRLAGAEDLLERAQTWRAALPRPVGTDQIDATVVGVLRGLTPGERLTARALAKVLHIAPESAARSILRLELAGAVEGDQAQPRGYRWLPFFLELPAGYAVARPQGKSWREQISTTAFYPDGARVELFVVAETARVHDGGGAALRMGGEGARAFLEQLAAERGVCVEGDELLVDPATVEGVIALAQASADAVAAWLSTAPGP